MSINSRCTAIGNLSVSAEKRKYIFPSAGENIPDAQIESLEETSPLPLKAMRKSFKPPQCLSKRRLYVFRPYPSLSHLFPARPFAQRLASTSAAKQPLSKTPFKKQPSSVSDSKPTNSIYETFEDEHTPRPLSRPLGQLQPPQPGENTGVDPRSWRERRDDFFNYEKHLVRRKQLYVFPFQSGFLLGRPGNSP